MFPDKKNSDVDEKGDEDLVRRLAKDKAELISQPLWDIKNKPTFIDREKCQRVRPMEVLCLGLERTGTVSLRIALLELGYYDVYHMSSPTFENPLDGEMWVRALDAKFENKSTFTRADWDKLLGHCMAVSDQPCATFAPELLAAYPDAKIILTVRDSAEQWQASIKRTVAPLHALLLPVLDPSSFWRKLLAPKFPFADFFLKLSRCTDWERVAEHGEEVYREHNEMVLRLAKEQGREVLVLNVKQGWEPLCRFLGKDVPDHQSFPRANEGADFEAKLAMFGRGVRFGYAANAVKYALGLGLSVAAAYYASRGRV